MTTDALQKHIQAVHENNIKFAQLSFGRYFEKHIEPVHDNNVQTAQFVVTVIL